MTTIITDSVREIALKYFSDIVYIDDALINPNNFLPINQTAVEQASSVEKTREDSSVPYRRLPPTRTIKDREEVADQINNTGEDRIRQTNAIGAQDYSKAFSLLYEFQQLGCKASPFYFESEDSVDLAVKLIETSHLTILDWELDSKGGEVTLRLLEKSLNKKNRMKMIVVYTRSPEKARDSLHGKYPNSPPEQIKSESGEYYLVKLENAFLLVCNKETFNAKGIMETFTDQIISNYGYFVFGFFDSINKMNDQTALILQRFSYPFDNALILQLCSSGFSQNDYAQIVSKMISNHFNKTTYVNSEILEGIILNWKREVSKLLDKSNEDLLSLIKNYIVEICKLHNSGTNGKRNIDNIGLLKEISADRWREYLNALDTIDLNRNKPFKEINTMVINDVLSIKSEKKMKRSLIEELEKLKKETKNDIIVMHKNKYKREVSEVLNPLIPVLFAFLLSSNATAPNIKRSVRELVEIMKVVPYDESSIENVAKLNDNELINFFSSGDILFKNDTEALICISPSCDAFNPAEKVMHHLKFIRGSIIKKDSEFQQLKEGQHLSVLPNPENLELLCIKWEFYKTEVIDIKNNFEQYKSYKRPYRFEQSYCQQIINSYLAYHSRSGVDELFFKKDSSMRNFFVFPSALE
ncbi:response regulator receiver domain [Paenibacillus sp. FSL H7-0716]|uniref:Response receiver domain-containing protein n=1 Tax=Paenibacillus odorifer TaxID=189426 RepID=A0AB36JCM2_9BACL|nr:response regulator receiver domain [Paenibacillus odorifer]OME16035.1 hypothetical protein BSK47_20785 [Paenibacillus odorifer]